MQSFAIKQCEIVILCSGVKISDVLGLSLSYDMKSIKLKINNTSLFSTFQTTRGKIKREVKKANFHSNFASPTPLLTQKHTHTPCYLTTTKILLTTTFQFDPLQLFFDMRLANNAHVRYKIDIHRN